MLFSKKEDLRYIRKFDESLETINLLSKEFRKMHFQSLDQFSTNFVRPKTEEEMAKEQEHFLKHLDVLQKLKRETDDFVSEAMKLVRNESVLTENDRAAIRQALDPKPASKTTIKVKGKKGKTRKKR